MDGENLTGSADEFLQLVGHTSPSEPDHAAVPEPDEELSAAADSDPAEEEEYDLSPEERVAAVLGEDLDEDDDVDPELVAADEGEDEDAADPYDINSLTEEQKTQLLEEALRAKAEAPQQERAAIQAEAAEAMAAAQQQMRQRIDLAFRQEVVLAISEPHYGALIAKAVENNDATEVQRIVRAKSAWEAEQREAWTPEANALIEQAGTQALKQHPGIRKLYAQQLAEDRKLPQKAIDTILEEADTDRMHTVADHLKQLRDVAADQQRRANQKVREEAARRSSANRITSPATGRPKPAKVVPLRGDINEWMAAKKRGAVG